MAFATARTRARPKANRLFAAAGTRAAELFHREIPVFRRAIPNSVRRGAATAARGRWAPRRRRARRRSAARPRDRRTPSSPASIPADERVSPTGKGFPAPLGQVYRLSGQIGGQVCDGLANMTVRLGTVRARPEAICLVVGVRRQWSPTFSPEEDYR